MAAIGIGGAILTAIIANLLKDTTLGGLDLYQQGRMGKESIALEGLKVKSAGEATKAANEENRRMAERYLAMLRSTQERQGARQSQDRQMQMVMALMGGMSNYQQQSTDAMIAGRRSAPPMALTTLMRGY